MEHFIMMIAPGLVIILAVAFLFIYAASSKIPADERE